MSRHDSTLKNKVSPHIQNQLPEFVQSDHPLFSTFLKHYYEFMEAGELVVTGDNEYLTDETLTGNYILEEDGLKIVLESSVGKFTAGETIVGQTSKATATVLVDDFDTNNRLFISSQQRFITGETIVGQTSGATTTVVSYRGNPVQTIQQLLAYADVDNTIYDFLDKFKDSLMQSLPNTVADGLSKRRLIKSIKELYSAKGTEDGHKMFFRILFDEEADISYPRENLLRPSDGIWSTEKLIRIIENPNSDFADAIGEILTGQTSGATARIVSIIKFREAQTLVAEITLDQYSIEGNFIEGETVSSKNTALDFEIFGVAKQIVTGAAVTEGGSYYQNNDIVDVTGGGGNGEATAKIEQIGTGSVDEIMIESGGSGYELGQSIIFDTRDTEGRDLSAIIAVVGGAIQLENKTAPDHFITEQRERILFEDSDFIKQETQVGEIDNLLMEDGGQIVLEEETFNDLGVPNEIGEITKVDIINRGNGFVKLPLASVSDTFGGSGASLYAISSVAPRIGHVSSVVITNYGLEYQTEPTLTLNKILVVKDVVGAFVAGDELASHNGTVVNLDVERNLLEIESTVTFNQGDTIQLVTGSSCVVYQADYASATSSIGMIGTTPAGISLTNDRGKISVDTMKIQDSLYYQDYSYVVRIGQSINEWRESIRRSVHPAGWTVFGEVSFASQVSAAIQTPAAGSVRDNASQDTFSPELASTFTNLFSVIFGRRLGTKTDGSELRGQTDFIRTEDMGWLLLETGDKIISRKDSSMDGSSEPLSSGVREVTLTSAVHVRMDTARGTHLSSYRRNPSLANLPVYAFASQPVEDTVAPAHYFDPAGRRLPAPNDISGSHFSIEQFGHFTIREACLADGSIPASAYLTRINVPPPSMITISRGALKNAFDNDYVSFDDAITTMDEEGTPRDTEGRYADSFDGTLRFDSGIKSFDVASGNEQDFVVTFDNDITTIDATELGGFDTAKPGTRNVNLMSEQDNDTFDSVTDTTWDESEDGITRIGFSILDQYLDNDSITFDKGT
jgi:hypothetical protein